MAPKQKLIPYNADGSIPNEARLNDQRFLWKPATPFLAVLHLDHMGWSRSSWKAIWRDLATGFTYWMSMTEFNRLIKQAEWVGPLMIDGTWIPTKREESYLIKAILPEDLPKD